MHENVINVTAEGNTLQLGNMVDRLHDKSTETFQTKITADFVNYVQIHGPKSEVFYNEERIYAMPEKRNRWGDRLAHCSISNSEQLKELMNKNMRRLPISEFENFLRAMLPFLVGDAFELIGQLKDLSISKITNIKRSSDNHGNYSFAVSRQGSAKEDFQPPATIKFKLPLLKHERCLSNIIDLEFDFIFTYKESEDDGVQITCQIQNWQLENIILEKKRDLIEAALKELGECTLYYGGLDTNQHSDEWTYNHHRVSL